ncbi:TRAP transporter small permease [Elioraea rosea]|uniref:TRAP transporter small permease n=1 Tax=Elioraea rosea TaxID=2492390 RepID=UPI00118262C5|nr:TRAP transporter small permease subunit [Elioraea rosea]
MARLAAAIGSAAIGLAALLTALFTAAVLWTVAARYGFGRTPVWAEELPRLLLVWAAFLGAGGAEARGGHLSAGLMPLILGEGRAARLGAAFADIAVIVFACLSVWATVTFIGIAGSGTTTALGLPASSFYWAGAAGLGLIAFGAAARLIDRFR